MLKSLGLFMMTGLFMMACSSHPVLPEKADITYSRETPPASCKNLGPIEGRSTQFHATPEDALEDLKAEAVRKGADYIRIETMGALSAGIRGTAYFCN